MERCNCFFRGIGLYLIIVLASLQGLSAQVNLEVRCAEDSTPLEQVLVGFADSVGSEFFAATDLNGYLGIELRDGQKVKLQFELLGYQTFTRKFISQSAKQVVYMFRDDLLLHQTVITGQYTANDPEKALHKIKLISKEELQAMAVQNLAQVLQMQSEFRVSQDRVLGSIISLGGNGGEQIKILIDGVPLSGRKDGNLDLSQIDLDNVERIEIIEGPLSVNFGSNALGGTINIITTSGIAEKYRLGLNTYYESVGQYNLSASFSKQLTGGFIQLGLGRKYFDGWDKQHGFSLLPTATLADTNRTMSWNPKEQYFGNFRLQFQGKKWQASAFLRGMAEELEIRGTPRAPLNLEAFDVLTKRERWDKGLEYMRKIGKWRKLRFLISHNDFTTVKNVYFKDLVDLSQSLTNNPGDQDSSKNILILGRTSFLKNVDSSSLNYEVGIEWQLEKLNSNRLENASEQVHETALYSSVEWKASPTLKIRPGFRFTQHQTYGSSFIPAINSLYRWNRFSLRTSAAGGYRAPSLTELYFEFVDINHNVLGNENLNPESSFNLQTNLAWRNWIAKGLLSWSVDGFYNKVSDKITLVESLDGTSFRYQNLDVLSSVGLGLKLSLQNKHWTGKMAIDNLWLKSSAFANQDWTGSPTLSLFVHKRFPKSQTGININYKFVGSSTAFVESDSLEFQSLKVDAYSLLDLGISQAVFNKQLHLKAGMKNLFDVQKLNTFGSGSAGIHSTNAPSLLAWGRSFYVGAQFKVKGKKPKENS